MQQQPLPTPTTKRLEKYAKKTTSQLSRHGKSVNFKQDQSEELSPHTSGRFPANNPQESQNHCKPIDLKDIAEAVGEWSIVERYILDLHERVLPEKDRIIKELRQENTKLKQELMDVPVRGLQVQSSPSMQQSKNNIFSETIAMAQSLIDKNNQEIAELKSKVRELQKLEDKVKEYQQQKLLMSKINDESQELINSCEEKSNQQDITNILDQIDKELEKQPEREDGASDVVDSQEMGISEKRESIHISEVQEQALMYSELYYLLLDGYRCLTKIIQAHQEYDRQLERGDIKQGQEKRNGLFTQLEEVVNELRAKYCDARRGE